MMFNTIEVRNAEKFYGSGENKKIVIDRLNMNVKPGSIYSLIGASGCGKTTLLSCILGMKSLDSGTIKVLGQRVKHERVSEVAHLIGYMPQNTALIRELTIRETLYYFGNIFQMSDTILAERYNMISNLLELPIENRRIENLSGGQQRRVSLAASMIHNPLILILDEPTVGLDSLLREKIWKFLLEQTRMSQLSVIITTHYISEAEQADRCGLMRDGRLMDEDLPANIVARYEANSLDEAFLNLCLLKKKIVSNTQNVIKIINFNDNETEQRFVDEKTIESFEKRKKFNKQTIKALLTKEFIRLRRQAGEIFFILILPILQVLAFAYGIGGNPIGLKIGIVNNELLDSTKCFNYLSKNVSYLNYIGECVYNTKSSCHLLQEIHDDDAKKLFYDTYESALVDAKNGKLSGIILLSENFTEVMSEPFDMETLNLKEGITIHMDKTNFQISTFLEHRLYRAYKRFNKRLFNGCEQNEKSNELPFKFEETFFGSLENNHRSTMMSPILFQILMFQGMGFSGFGIAQSRVDGVWNRTLLSGVHSAEILIAQLILSIFVVAISFVEIIITAILTMEIVMVGSYIIIFIFGLFSCLCGSLIGMTISAMSENLNFIMIMLFGIMQTFTLLCGSIWPIEGQPTIFRYFSYILPASLPSLSVRNIMMKNFGLIDSSVYIGLIVLTIWTLVSIFAVILIMKKRKFAEC